METEDEHAHTFTCIGWQARLLVKKLRNQAPERLAEAEAPASKSREGKSLEETSAPPSEKRREAVKFK
jgi:hypothetical protein